MKIRKFKHLIHASKYEELNHDMKDLHMAKDEKTYKKLLCKFKDKYEKRHNAMFLHIWNTWINTRDHTHKWQIFRNKAGFANTNSPLESYNKLIKHQFFKRVVMSIGGALAKLEEIILYYSNNCKKFECSPRFVKKTYSLAKTLTKDNFKVINKSSVSYIGVKNKFTLNINDNSAYKQYSCNCKYYMKDAICMHLVGYNWVKSKNLYKNYSNEPTKFAIRTKLGRHKLTAKAGEFN